MRPGMAGNLMALGNHALDEAGVLYVNHALADIISGDEPGGNSPVGLEGIQHGFRVDIRAVIVGDGDVAIINTVEDTDTAIGDAAKQGSRIVGRIPAGGLLVAVAGRAVADLAIGRVAVNRALAAPSRSRAAVPVGTPAVPGPALRIVPEGNGSVDDAGGCCCCLPSPQNLFVAVPGLVFHRRRAPRLVRVPHLPQLVQAPTTRHHHLDVRPVPVGLGHFQPGDGGQEDRRPTHRDVVGDE